MVLQPTELSLVTFKIGNELFGMQLHQIKEIIRIPEIIHVPNAPSFIEGIINLRGSVVCILDLHKRFDIKKEGSVKQGRVIVVDIKDRIIGLIVDRVVEVVYLNPSLIEPIPKEVSTIDTRFLNGVGKYQDKFILLINVEKMFSTEELLKLAGTK